MKLPSQQFTALPRELLESSAWRILSHPAMKALFRLCIEHMAHGGAENGRLCVTHRQFMAAGVGHNRIKPALIELEALGFIEMVMQGGKSFGDTRMPSRFRLTFVQGKQCDPTHEWHAVRDEEHGRALVATARAEWEQERDPRSPTGESTAPRSGSSRANPRSPTGESRPTPSSGSPVYILGVGGREYAR